MAGRFTPKIAGSHWSAFASTLRVSHSLISVWKAAVFVVGGHQLVGAGILSYNLSGRRITSTQLNKDIYLTENKKPKIGR